MAMLAKYTLCGLPWQREWHGRFRKELGHWHISNPRNGISKQSKETKHNRHGKMSTEGETTATMQNTTSVTIHRGNLLPAMM